MLYPHCIRQFGYTPMVVARVTILCDFVQQVQAGKVNLIGVFERFHVKDVPIKVPRFYFFSQLKPGSPEELIPGETELTLMLAAPESTAKELLTLPLPAIDKPDEVGGASIIIEFRDLLVEAFGNHRMSLLVNRSVATEIEFEVMKKNDS